MMGVELSLDTASDYASIALCEEGRARDELTWHCPRNHSVELLPAVERMMEGAGIAKGDLSAVFVCTGPGGYASLRVGVSTAKGLAFALGVPLVGVGRLEVEAYPLATRRRPICPLHRAGRAEVAWALYVGPSDEWRELSPPALAPLEEVVRQAPAEALFCGEDVDKLAMPLRELGVTSQRLAPSAPRRASVLAELAWRRLRAGQNDDPRSLTPVYLRQPTIGPQPAPIRYLPADRQDREV